MRFGKVLALGTNFFSARDVQWVKVPLMYICDPLIISKTTRARKLNLIIPLYTVKYPLCLQTINNQDVIKMSDGHRNVVIR